MQSRASGGGRAIQIAGIEVYPRMTELGELRAHGPSGHSDYHDMPGLVPIQR